MKLPLTVLATLMILGCSVQLTTPLPTDPGTTTPAPDPPTSPIGTSASGMIFPRYGGSGACIAGATVRVLDGEQLGPPITQEPCSWWDYGGGFTLTGLTPGVAVRVRASAPGYADRDDVLLPGQGVQIILLDELPPD